MVLVVRDDADVVDAQIAFHLNAGVDFVIVTDHSSTDGTADILESYARDGYVRRVCKEGDARDTDWRASMARLAVSEHGADWVIDSDADEFWMPRAESIKDILVAIPPRYGIVQSLVRVFLPRPDDGESFIDRMNVRRPLSNVRDDESNGRLDWALRPIHRVDPNMVVSRDRHIVLDGRVPLRAWYPVEVLRFPLRSLEQAERRALQRSGPSEARSRIEQELFAANALGARWTELVVDDDELDRRVGDGSLVVDERLRDALRNLEQAAAGSEPARRFALPRHESGHLAMQSSSVVEDVAYAGECAAVREVDFEPLRDRISELERRITDLESRLLPRVRRRLAALVGR